MESPLVYDVAKLKPESDLAGGGPQEEAELEDGADAKDDHHGDEYKDDEDAASLEHMIGTEEVNDRGPFQQYFAKTENVAERKRLSYIMMMFKALGFNVEEIYPYSEILRDRSLGGGGWIRSLKATKALVAQELLRQNPKARLNQKNQTLEQLLSRMRPLTDSRDIHFVMKEERKIRQKFYELVRIDWSKDGFVNKQINLTKQAPARKTESKESLTEIRKEKNNELKAESSKNQGKKNENSLYVTSHVLCTENKRQKTILASTKDDERSQAASDSAKGTLFLASYYLSSVLAENAMHAAINFAVIKDWKTTVAIVDAGGSPVLVKRLDGASSASYDVALGRAKNAARFMKSTGEIEKDARGLDSVLHDSVLTPFLSKRGGCPILISNCSRCIGAIGVSGAPTATNDEQVANAGVTFITCLFNSQKR